jgi:hypothetical protein
MDTQLFWLTSFIGCVGWGLAGWLAYKRVASPMPEIREISETLTFNYTNSDNQNRDHTIKDVIAYKATGNIYIDGHYGDDDERYSFRANRIQHLECPDSKTRVAESPLRWLSDRAGL